MPTYTDKQIASQKALKAKIAGATPGGSVSSNASNPLYKNITQGTAKDIPLAATRAPNTAYTSQQDLDRSAAQFEASPGQANVQGPILQKWADRDPEAFDIWADKEGWTKTPVAPPKPGSGNGNLIQQDGRTFGNNSNSSIFGMYGIPENSQPGGDLYGVYGMKQPTKMTADTTDLNSDIERLKPTGDTDQIKKMLDSQMAEISNRYQLERDEIKRATASEFQSQLSGLYNTGVVNPLSSGTGSIDAASDMTLDRRIAASQAQETAEKSAAIARAYDRETESKDKALQFAKDERARLENEATQQYEYERQQMADKVSLVNNVVNAWKSGQAASRQEKIDAQAGVMDLISTFGSSAFEGMDENKISEVEQATGYPPGSLFKGIVALKQKELVKPDEAMELRTVGGNLYNLYRDAEGMVKAELIIPGKSGSGGGGGSNNPTTKKIKFEDWLAQQQDKNSVSYNIGDPKILDQLISSYEMETGKTKDNIITQAFKDRNTTKKFTYETRNVDGQTVQLKKDSTGKIVETIPIGSSSNSSSSDDEDESAPTDDAAAKAIREALGL